MKHLNKFNENVNNRFFFDSDCSSHWYMVPLNLKDKWIELNTSDEDDQDTIDKFEEMFNHFRCNDITTISFENPSKQ